MGRDGRFFIQALTNDSKNMTSDQAGSLVRFRILEFFVVPRLRAEAHDGRFSAYANGRIPLLSSPLPNKQTYFSRLKSEKLRSTENKLYAQINLLGKGRFVSLRAAYGRTNSTQYSKEVMSSGRNESGNVKFGNLIV